MGGERKKAETKAPGNEIINLCHDVALFDYLCSFLLYFSGTALMSISHFKVDQDDLWENIWNSDGLKKLLTKYKMIFLVIVGIKSSA